jgi:hypothetical protein
LERPKALAPYQPPAADFLSVQLIPREQRSYAGRINGQGLSRICYGEHIKTRHSHQL